MLTRVAVETSARAVTQAMRHAELKIALLKFNSPGSERMVDPKESERLVRETRSQIRFHHTPIFSCGATDGKGEGNAVGVW